MKNPLHGKRISLRASTFAAGIAILFVFFMNSFIPLRDGRQVSLLSPGRDGLFQPLIAEAVAGIPEAHRLPVNAIVAASVHSGVIRRDTGNNPEGAIPNVPHPHRAHPLP